jgi:hypothetical protein
MKMNDSPFDPQSFLDSTLPGANSTKRELIPPGVYKAYISKLDVRNGTVGKEGPNYGKPWVALNIQWTVEDQAVNASMDQSKIIVFDSVFLDLDEAGAPAMGKGKNVQLGKLREALGMNTGPLQFRALEGRPATINVVHETYKDDMQAVVKSYARS